MEAGEPRLPANRLEVYVCTKSVVCLTCSSYENFLLVDFGGRRWNDATECQEGWDKEEVHIVLIFDSTGEELGGKAFEIYIILYQNP
jgi:hypothetical protein